MRRVVLLVMLLGAAVAAPAAPAANERPALVSFQARFVPQLFGTIYTAYARDPERRPVSVNFLFRAPKNDPKCKQCETDPDVTQRSGASWTQRATWSHGDQHGCDHRREGPYGHDGFITVTFGDGAWNCRATYRGSHSTPRVSRLHAFCSRNSAG